MALWERVVGVVFIKPPNAYSPGRVSNTMALSVVLEWTPPETHLFSLKMHRHVLATSCNTEPRQVSLSFAQTGPEV